MRVLFDALGLPSYGGAKSSALGWIRSVAEQGAEHQFLTAVSKREPALDELPNLEQFVAPPSGRFGVRLWAQRYLPQIVRTRNIDLVHFTKNHGCLFVPCPTVITINDLSRLYYPALFSSVDVFYWKTIQRVLLKRVDQVIAISETTKRDLMHFYHLPPEKVHVIYPALAPQFRDWKTDTEKVPKVLQKYGIRSPYILSVGGMALHKNVYTTLRAFYALLDQGRLGDYTFVIVGEQIHTHNDQRLFDLANQHNRKQVCFTGIVDDDDIPYIYAGASLFVYPSLYEGLGLAPLEAMACGTPVLAARSGGVPEVVGSAGWLLDDPLDAAGFATAIAALLADDHTLARMSARGLERSRAFTWGQTAERTLALYREIASEQA